MFAWAWYLINIYFLIHSLTRYLDCRTFSRLPHALVPCLTADEYDVAGGGIYNSHFSNYVINVNLLHGTLSYGLTAVIYRSIPVRVLLFAG